jgi:hypothetical protein
VLLVCTVYSVLYSEIALSRKPFGIGHMYIYTFLLRTPDTMTSLNTDFSSWDNLCINRLGLLSHRSSADGTKKFRQITLLSCDPNTE